MNFYDQCSDILDAKILIMDDQQANLRLLERRHREAGQASIASTTDEAMQRHWFLRNYVNPANPPPAQPLSEIAAPETKPVKTFRLSNNRR